MRMCMYSGNQSMSFSARTAAQSKSNRVIECWWPTPRRGVFRRDVEVRKRRPKLHAELVPTRRPVRRASAPARALYRDVQARDSDVVQEDVVRVGESARISP